MVSASTRGTLLGVAARAKDALDSAVLRGKQATGLLRPLHARPYLGHGTAEVAYVKGRVRELPGRDQPRLTDGLLQNLAATVRQFTATPVPGARVRISFADTETEVISDADGYFRATLWPPRRLTAGWHDVSATLLHPRVPGSTAGPTVSQLLVPSADASFGIISDLDDTVLRSEATSPWRAVATVLLSNALTRTPFVGVAAFYRALQLGPSGSANNPLFYVSSGPWNLYDFVTGFLQCQHIPTGPLFLRAWGLDADALPSGGHRGHKSELILGLLDTYPQLRFVLIGDSGQQDPEIYRDIALRTPSRVLAVYIRDVTTPKRDREVHAIAQQVRKTGVPFCLVSNTGEAARSAAELGLLTPESANAVLAAVSAESSTATPPSRPATTRPR